MATSLIPRKVQKQLVTYYVDTDTVYTAKVKRKNDALLNLAFTPELDGWTFVGWREDTEASNDVLESAIVDKEEITLYAVFAQTITLSYDGNSATSGSVSSQTGTRYYNAAGNYSNPTFTLASNGYTKTNYVFLAWGYGSASGTQYAAGETVTLSESKTFYAVWDVICRIVLSIAGTNGTDLYFYIKIYNNATGATLASYTHRWGSVYSSWVEYGGAIRVRWYETTSDPWYYATWVALTDLYSSSSLSTVSLATGNSASKTIPNEESSTTVATYYARQSKLSL